MVFSPLNYQSLILGTVTNFGGETFSNAPIMIDLMNSPSGCSASPGRIYIEHMHGTTYPVINTLTETSFPSVAIDGSPNLVLTELIDVAGARLDFSSAAFYEDPTCQADYNIDTEAFPDEFLYAGTGTSSFTFTTSQTLCGSFLSFSLDEMTLLDQDGNDMMQKSWVSYNFNSLQIDTDDPALEFGDWTLQGAVYDTSSRDSFLTIDFSLTLSIENGNEAPVLGSDTCEGLVVA